MVAGLTPTCVAILDLRHTVGGNQQRLRPLNWPVTVWFAKTTRSKMLLVDRPT